MKPETKFSAKVQKKLKAVGCHVVRIQAGSIRGYCDLYICRRGVFFGWELKVDDNKPTKLQEREIEQIVAAGGYAWVVYPENLETSINQLVALSEKDFHERNALRKKKGKK